MQHKSLREKHSARLAAVQALYNADVVKSTKTVEQLVRMIMDQWQDPSNKTDDEWEVKDKPHKTLLLSLVQGVTDHLAEINAQVDSVIKSDWKQERMSPILVAVLQCSIYELQFKPDVKTPIIVDEYTSIVQQFFDEPELGFMHSALRQLAERIRP